MQAKTKPWQQEKKPSSPSCGFYLATAREVSTHVLIVAITMSCPSAFLVIFVVAVGIALAVRQEPGARRSYHRSQDDVGENRRVQEMDKKGKIHCLYLLPPEKAKKKGWFSQKGSFTSTRGLRQKPQKQYNDSQRARVHASCTVSMSFFCYTVSQWFAMVRDFYSYLFSHSCHRTAPLVSLAGWEIALHRVKPTLVLRAFFQQQQKRDPN